MSKTQIHKNRRNMGHQINVKNEIGITKFMKAETLASKAMRE